MRARITIPFLLLIGASGCAPSDESSPPTASTTSAASESPERSPTEARSPISPEQKADSQPNPPSAIAKEGKASSKPESAEVRNLDELLLFQPAKHPIGDWNPTDLQYEDVWFEAADGVRLHGWYCPTPNPRAYLLYAHGNAGNLSHRAGLIRYLQNELQVAALIFDYRGYGRSEGVPTVEGALQDARAARHLLAKQADVSEADIVLMGRSLGGAVVVQLASERPPRGLILESTFSSLRKVAAHHFGRLSWIVPADKLNSATAIMKYHGPLLQSHGDADTTVPYALGRQLFEAANEPKEFVTITGGDHNDRQSREYYRKLDMFIDSLP